MAFKRLLKTGDLLLTEIILDSSKGRSTKKKWGQGLQHWDSLRSSGNVTERGPRSSLEGAGVTDSKSWKVFIPQRGRGD